MADKKEIAQDIKPNFVGFTRIKEVQGGEFSEKDIREGKHKKQNYLFKG